MSNHVRTYLRVFMLNNAFVNKDITTMNVVERLGLCEEFQLDKLREKIMQQLTSNRKVPYVRPYVRTYLRTYVRTYVRACVRTHVH